MPFRTALAISVCMFAAIQAGAQDLPVFDGSHFGKVVITDNQSALGRIRNEALIGAQNIEFISNYSPNSPFAQLGRAVGKLDILTDTNKFAPCTGFLVEGNKVVTNYHCVPGVLDHPQIGGNAIVAVQLHLGFIRDGIKGNTQSFHVSPVPLEMNKELDYTVLQVLGDANAEFGALQLSAVVPEDLTPFWVIGHPLGEAQRISREKCQASVPAVEGLRVIHTCDTMPGSSGSPVIDTGLQQVVALHNASAGSVNLAVPMAEILAQSKVLKAVKQTFGDDDLAEERARLAMLQTELEAERERLKVAAEKVNRGPSTVVAPDMPSKAPETECDRLAADPMDRQKIVSVSGFFDLKRIDLSRAISACEQAVRHYPAEPRFIYQLARALDYSGRYENAMQHYQLAQAAGHVASMTMIGWLYQNGQGVDADLDEAGRWFRKASEKGDTKAIRALGYRLRLGEGVERDFEAARRLYRQAADRGDMRAMSGIGILYYNGEGVEKDFAEALRWYEKAVQTGNQPGTLWKLATMYSSGEGVTVDHRRSAYYAFRAVLYGNSRALDQSKRPKTVLEFRREIQRLLKDRGVYEGAIDGVIGPGTRAALDAVFNSAACGPDAGERC